MFGLKPVMYSIEIKDFKEFLQKFIQFICNKFILEQKVLKMLFNVSLLMIYNVEINIKIHLKTLILLQY